MSSYDSYVFYISTHGYRAKNLPGKPMYLCATDFDPERPERQGLRTTTLLQFLQSLPPRNKYAIIGACFSAAGLLSVENSELDKANEAKEFGNRVLHLTSTIEPLLKLQIDPSLEYLSSTGPESEAFARNDDIFHKRFIQVMRTCAHKKGYFSNSMVFSDLTTSLTSETGTKEHRYPDTMVPATRKFGSGALVMMAKKKHKLLEPNFDTHATKYFFLGDQEVQEEGKKKKPEKKKKVEEVCRSRFGVGQFIDQLETLFHVDGFKAFRALAEGCKCHGPLLTKAMWKSPAPAACRSAGVNNLLQLFVRRISGAFRFLENTENLKSYEKSTVDIFYYSLSNFIFALSDSFLGCWLLKDESITEGLLAKKLPKPHCTKFTLKIEKSYSALSSISLPTRRLEDSDVSGEQFLQAEVQFGWKRLCGPCGMGTGLRILHSIEMAAKKIKPIELTGSPNGFIDSMEYFAQEQAVASGSLVRVINMFYKKFSAETKYQLVKKIRTLDTCFASVHALVSELEKGARPPSPSPPVALSLASATAATSPSFATPISSTSTNSDLSSPENISFTSPSPPSPYKPPRSGSSLPARHLNNICEIFVKISPIRTKSCPKIVPVPPPSTAAKVAPGKTSKESKKSSSGAKIEACTGSAANQESTSVGTSLTTVTLAQRGSSLPDGLAQPERLSAPTASTSAAVNASASSTADVTLSPRKSSNMHTSANCATEEVAQTGRSGAPRTLTGSRATRVNKKTKPRKGTGKTKKAQMEKIVAKSAVVQKRKVDLWADAEEPVAKKAKRESTKEPTAEEGSTTDNNMAPLMEDIVDSTTPATGNVGTTFPSTTTTHDTTARDIVDDIPTDKTDAGDVETDAQPVMGDATSPSASNGSDSAGSDTPIPAKKLLPVPDAGPFASNSLVKEPVVRKSTRTTKQEEASPKELQKIPGKTLNQELKVFEQLFGVVSMKLLQATIEAGLTDKCIAQYDKWEGYAMRLRQIVPPFVSHIEETPGMTDDLLMSLLKSQFAHRWQDVLGGSMTSNLVASSNAINKVLKTYCELGFSHFRLAWKLYPGRSRDQIFIQLTKKDWQTKKVHDGGPTFFKIKKVVCELNGFTRTEIGYNLNLKEEDAAARAAELQAQQQFLNNLVIPKVDTSMLFA